MLVNSPPEDERDAEFTRQDDMRYLGADMRYIDVSVTCIACTFTPSCKGSAMNFIFF